jgi:hypothetical protein
MFYGRYTHINEILEKVRDEFGFEDVPIDTAMEHVWMAMGKIGVKDILEDCDEEIVITDGRGIMPANVMYIEGIREQESQLVLIPSKDIFIKPNIEFTPETRTYIAGYTVTGASDDINTEATLEPNYAYVEVQRGNNYDYGDSIGYQIRGDYIFCEISDCTLEIKYKGFPIWDDNTPKIPDDAKFIDFIVDYIGEKVAKKLYLSDRLSRDKFEMISRDRMWSQGASKNKFIIPDDTMMEMMRRMQQRLIPKPEQFGTGFKYLNERERLK